MDIGAAIERLERIAVVRTDAAAIPDELTGALRACHELTAFLAAAEADLARRLTASVSFPEATIADITRDTLSAATKTIERSTTLDALPAMAAALDTARTTPAHIDAITRETKNIDPRERDHVNERLDTLVDIATHATVDQFRRRVRTEIERARSDDGTDRLERQRRATRLRTWTDTDGMWNLRGRFDPITALRISSALDRAVEASFADAAPDTSPSDPIDKQHHLRALALASLVDGTDSARRPGRPEFVAVIDISAPPPETSTSMPAADGPCGHRATSSTGGAPTGDGRPMTTRRTTSRIGGSQRRGGSERSGSPNDRTDEPVLRTERADGAPARPPTPADSCRAGPRVTWPIPIEVPTPVLAQMIEDADTTTVVVRDGVVLHAPGRLDLARTTRLANRAQRRALRALYPTCAIPSCTVAYDRCKLHHITWWRHGGTTDLQNLLPVCVRHHTKIHDSGWIVHLDHHRRLTLTLPDGTTRTTDPPRRDTS
ncbi:HNH endonuclease [Ilumatobacter sp.]|uniref:HNH endonuclease signature motif containing protein n=1 Tax=Ilumatobacter sp. TaxID=1967498 RepID=UPI003B52196E